MDISVKKLYKSYGDKTVFSDYSVCFHKGKIYCIMGHSGRGKTTLLRILSGLEKPDTGIVEGVPKSVGFCFQEEHLVEEFSAVANIHLTNRKLPVSVIENALLSVGIGEEEWKQKISQFSKGMKRRVSVLQALLSEGEVLLLDEPFAGLDFSAKERVIQLIKEKQRGRTILLSTHDEGDAALLGGVTIHL